MYSICGLVVFRSEKGVCTNRKFPFVALGGDFLLVPLNQDFLFLAEGDGTPAATDFEFTVPDWLHDMASSFSKCAFIEAEFWGGTGMQACVVFEKQGTLSEALISSDAINFALRRMGIDDERGKDPFDVVELGRHRSVEGWLQEAVRLSNRDSEI